VSENCPPVFRWRLLSIVDLKAAEGATPENKSKQQQSSCNITMYQSEFELLII
jgi:hypothetical protein